MNLSALLLRCDASESIGIGHVMRCFALAQAWAAEGLGPIHLAATTLPKILIERFSKAGVAVRVFGVEKGSSADAKSTVALARDIDARWVVLDGYHFGSDYEESIKSADLHLLALDDTGHTDHSAADVVLNQNIYASRAMYPMLNHKTRLLTGPDYALLRQEFWPWRSWRRNTDAQARKVLVTLGGYSQHQVILQIIEALKKISNVEPTIAVGINTMNLRAFKDIARELGWPLVANADNLPELMARADVAISAAGSTSLELLFMELPSLVIAMGENQEPVADALKMVGAAESLGWYSEVSASMIEERLKLILSDEVRRYRMSQLGRKYVDGRGSQRVTEFLMNGGEADKVLMHVGSDQLRLRHVCEDDCKLLWKWANDSKARVASFSQESIPWEEHVRWFRSKLGDPHCVFYIATNNGGIPIGQIRYDFENDEASVSVSIDREFRGKGYGSMLISLSAQKVFDAAAIATIHAYVKQGNEASVCAFEKVGFKNIGTKAMKGQEAVHLTLTRSR